MGLIKYVMALMNGARLGIAAQSVGLSSEAYKEGLNYAKERAQFGKKIITFPAVYDMLSRMKAKVDAGTFATLSNSTLCRHLQGVRGYCTRPETNG